MVEVLDPEVADTQSTTKKRGGGAQTLRGRMRSRENAVKSSLRSKVVFSKDMASRILERNWLLDAQFPPKTRYEQMLIADMALAKARIDRTAELLIENEDRYIDRTIDYWNHDQELRALNLKARISKDPARVALTLSGFKQGADLMITTWQGLSRALAATGDWDEDQRRLCLDLLGVPRELRAGNWLLPPTVDKADLAATAAAEIARLQAKKAAWLDEHDEFGQDDALVGLLPADDPTTKRLRRYETMAKRDYQKAFDELKRVQAEGEARFKESGIKTTLRAWDTDSLIDRIKSIQDPPGLRAEVQDNLPPIRRVDQGPPVAGAPAQAVAEPTPPAVAPDATTQPPAACVTMPAGTADSQGESDSPAAVASASSTTVPLTILPLPVASETAVPTTPLSRRARKVLQKRLRQSAQRQAGKKPPSE